ncbi:MAG: hypothetical protein SV062_08105 [Thermodesulfobacteriota bacterium]|nr:hypothetical protein [Thermodesulfobacteriota bacterium]
METFFLFNFIACTFGGIISGIGIGLWIGYEYSAYRCSLIIIIGYYIAFCTFLGIYFPWLPFSQWWRWFL